MSVLERFYESILVPVELPLITELRAAMSYHADTGILTWKTRPGSDLPTRRWNGRCAGKSVGSRHINGYIQLTFTDSTGCTHKLLVHRVVFALMTGRWPICIDHRNHRRNDNRWANLRETDHFGNCANRNSAASSAGFKGVCYRQTQDRYHAQIHVRGVTHHLGSFLTANDAALAYDKAARLHFGEFSHTNSDMRLL